MERYAPISAVTRQSMEYAGNVLGPALDAVRIDRLMATWLHLDPFAAVRTLLENQREMTMRVAILSNGSPTCRVRCLRMPDSRH